MFADANALNVLDLEGMPVTARTALASGRQSSLIAPPSCRSSKLV
ncbi:MAG: hypothetical protein ACRDUY_12445 [Nitriliruptorales bacterium]